MTQAFTKTKPSLMEAGLPCSSLSAECQRDNNARQRPPQNRLHIWWARRPPTVCRAAILAGLLPYDLNLPEHVLPQVVAEPTQADLDDLPAKIADQRPFFERMLRELAPTSLTPEHERFLRAMGIKGDSDLAYRRIQMAANFRPDGTRPINMGVAWSYRHPPAFAVTPTDALTRHITSEIRRGLGLA